VLRGNFSEVLFERSLKQIKIGSHLQQTMPPAKFHQVEKEVTMGLKTWSEVADSLRLDSTVSTNNFKAAQNILKSDVAKVIKNLK